MRTNCRQDTESDRIIIDSRGQVGRVSSRRGSASRRGPAGFRRLGTLRMRPRRPPWLLESDALAVLYTAEVPRVWVGLALARMTPRDGGLASGGGSRRGARSRPL